MEGVLTDEPMGSARQGNSVNAPGAGGGGSGCETCTETHGEACGAGAFLECWRPFGGGTRCLNKRWLRGGCDGCCWRLNSFGNRYG